MGKPRKYQTKKEGNRERNKKWRKTQIGRASYLLNKYRAMDRRKGFGDVIDFDARWIVENIFTQKCKYCDESDWRKLGCNRIDNSKPHTKDNVEPCCWKHNTELGLEELGLSPIPIAQFDKVTGELIAVWESAHEAVRELGYSQGNISECCNGKRKQAYGFVWRKLSKDEYETLRACLG